jgi:hypothetical protein
MKSQMEIERENESRKLKMLDKYISSLFKDSYIGEETFWLNVYTAGGVVILGSNDEESGSWYTNGQLVGTLHEVFDVDYKYVNRSVGKIATKLYGLDIRTIT